MLNWHPSSPRSRTRGSNRDTATGPRRRPDGPPSAGGVGADAAGATDAEIKKAIKGGTDALKARYAKGVPEAGESHGVGDACLAGLALLEGEVSPDDPAVKLITARVRDASYKQTRTYQIALCVMYLDRLGNPADVPLIQMLAVRLLVGQTPNGGWDYICIQAVGADDEQRLRGMTANQPAGKLHPEVERYGQALTAARAAGTVASGDDNSNTQFGVLATWMARKHGVPVEEALKRIEERFTTTQNQRGSWPYSGGAAGGLMANAGSPSMYCSGLLGMATGLARREDRKLKAENPDPKRPDPKKADPKPDPNAGDPFYNPPALGAKPDPKQGPRPTGPQDRVIQFAFTGLGQVIAEQIRSGKGLNGGGTGDGHFDLYFLWSLERVGVVYDVDKIGGVDWYDVGSTALVRVQNADGTWPGSYGTDVNTAFAVLFLCKSNLARDLSSKVKKESNTEMRAGAATARRPSAAPSARPPARAGRQPAQPDQRPGRHAGVQAAQGGRRRLGEAADRHPRRQGAEQHPRAGAGGHPHRRRPQEGGPRGAGRAAVPDDPGHPPRDAQVAGDRAAAGGGAGVRDEGRRGARPGPGRHDGRRQRVRGPGRAGRAEEPDRQGPDHGRRVARVVRGREEVAVSRLVPGLNVAGRKVEDLRSGSLRPYDLRLESESRSWSGCLQPLRG